MESRPEHVRDLDGLASALAALRDHAGVPSYRAIAERVGALRRAGGVPLAEAVVGKVTVYECFRPGRRRMDAQLVIDIVRVLGVRGDDVDLWRTAIARAHRSATDQSSAALPSLPVVTTVTSQRPLIGRDRLLADLSIALGQGGVVILEGLGGVGKTALAEQVVRRTAEDAGLALRIDLGCGDDKAPPGAEQVMAAVLAHLGVHRDSSPADEQFASICAERRLVLLLDDAADSSVAGELAELSGVPVLVTSRRPLDGAGKRLSVPHLDPADAAALLCREASLPATRSVEPQIRALASLADGLPLAVELIAGRLPTHPGWSLVDHRQALESDPIGGSEAVGIALGKSYSHLSTQARSALRQICLHALDTLWPETVDGALGAAVTAGLAELREHHLLGQEADGRWRVHSLVRQFARDQSVREDPPSARVRTIQAYLDHYLSQAMSAVGTVHPMAPPSWTWADALPQLWPQGHAVEWLARHSPAVVAAVLDANVADHAVAIARLAEVMTWHLVTGAPDATVLAMARRGRAAAEESEDLAGRGRAERTLGNTYLRLGRLTDAALCFGAARELSGAAGQFGDATAALGSLASVASYRGDQREAIALLEQVRREFLVAGDDIRAHVALTNLAVCHTRAGDLEPSVDIFVAAVDEASAHGWDEREMMALGNAIEPLLAVGRSGVARDYNDRETRLAHRLGDEVTNAYAVLHRALVAAHAGAVEEAIALGHKVLEEAARLRHSVLAAQTHNQVGGWELVAGHQERAVEHFGSALRAALDAQESTEQERARQGLRACGRTVQPNPAPP